MNPRTSSPQVKRTGVLNLFRAIAPTYRLRTAFNLGLLVLAGLSEGLGIAGLLPLLGILLGERTASASSLAQKVKTLLGMIGLEPTLW
ncbi:MAG: hypothetical protein FJ118_20605, partial [Deltaproteobacteria bacterium]|nr:hypothetical protein [Deltaproteobacteria bacterium]